MDQFVNEDDCFEVIKHLYSHSQKNIVIDNFKVGPFSKNSTGFLGNHLKLQISVKSPTEEDGMGIPKRINAFVKTLPIGLNHRQYVEETNVFDKEYNFFRRLAPVLRQISIKIGDYWAPDCYLAKKDLLIFEDLSQSGFKNISHIKLMDFEHLKITADTLGRFHSVSVFLEYHENKHCSIKEEFNDCIFECIYVDDPRNARYNWFENGIVTLVKMATAIDKYTDRQKTQIAHRMPVILNQIKHLYKPSQTMRNVICHGDLWMNNILFRYDDNDKPIACRLIDFQVIRYAPAALDLACMIYLCSDKNTRAKYENEVIKAYEIAFNKALLEFGVKPLYNNLLEDVKSFKAAALMEACLYEMVTRLDSKTITRSLSSPENVQQFFFGDRSEIAFESFMVDNAYRIRMSELVEELVDNFVLI